MCMSFVLLFKCRAGVVVVLLGKLCLVFWLGTSVALCFMRYIGGKRSDVTGPNTGSGKA